MNILYILLDQIRKDMLGACGHQIVKTPNIDRLAKDGIRFNNAFTPASVCGPARTSLFTGLMPSTHGIIRNGEKVVQAKLRNLHQTSANWKATTPMWWENGTLARNLCQKIMAFKDIILMAMATLAAACIKTLCLINHQLTPIAIKSGWKKKAMRFQR